MNDSDSGTGRMQSLAVIETATRIDELRRILGQEKHTAAFALEPCRSAPPGRAWFNIHVDGTNAINAVITVREVLCALLDGADRGLVEHFRIVSGADLLRRTAPGAGQYAPAGEGPCTA